MEKQQSSNGQMNVKGQDNSKLSSELLSREPIEGTPFYITGNEENGYAITFGKYRLTEITKTTVEQLEKLDMESWLISSRMMGIIAQIVYDDNSKPLYDIFKITKEDLERTQEELNPLITKDGTRYETK